MTDHYYSKNPSSKSEPVKWEYDLRGTRFRFTSDYGVFSKSGVDFGSKLLIEHFSEPNIEGMFLDVGCGYGAIGITLAKSFPNRTVHMIDVNNRAIQLAKQNAEENDVQNVEVFESDVFSKVENRNYASVVTNPPIRAGKKVVHSIFEQSFQHLSKNGSLWVVIQKKQGAPSAIKKLEEVFGEVSVVKKEKGYFIIRADKV